MHSCKAATTWILQNHVKDADLSGAAACFFPCDGLSASEMPSQPFPHGNVHKNKIVGHIKDPLAVLPRFCQ